jgi:hypothetical protein
MRNPTDLGRHYTWCCTVACDGLHHIVHVVNGLRARWLIIETHHLTGLRS